MSAAAQTSKWNYARMLTIPLVIALVFVAWLCMAPYAKADPEGDGVCAVVYRSHTFVVQQGSAPDPTRGKAVFVYKHLDDTQYSADNPPPWRRDSYWIGRVVFESGAPSSVAHWFDGDIEDDTEEDYQITSVDFSGLDARRLTDVARTFVHCPLVSVDLSMVNAPLLESTRSMFYGCWKMNSVNLSGMRAAKLKDASWMFGWCGMETAVLRDFPAANMRQCKDMFCHCRHLKTVDVTGWDTGRLESCARMFLDCRALEEVRGLGTWKTPRLYSCSRMFEDCWKLRRADMTGWSSARLVHAKGMFARCAALESVTLGKRFGRLPAHMLSGLRNELAVVTVRSKKLTASRVSRCAGPWTRIESWFGDDDEGDESLYDYHPAKIRAVKVQVGSKKANRRYAKKYRKLFTKKTCGAKIRVAASKRAPKG